MYINQSTLEMCLASQKALETNYKQENSGVKKLIWEQTHKLLSRIVDGSVQIAEQDIAMVEKLLGSYLRTAYGRNKNIARKLSAKLKPFLQQRRHNLSRLADFNYVAYVLNNKKSAISLSQEELLKSLRTIKSYNAGSNKLKQRLLQQVQSYALLKYRTLPAQEIKSGGITQEFVRTFGLSHVKANSAVVQKQTVSAVRPATAQPAKPQISWLGKLSASASAIISLTADKLADIRQETKSRYHHLRHRVKSFYYRHEYKIAAFTIGLVGLGMFQTHKQIEKAEQATQYKLFVAPTLHKSNEAKTASFTHEYAKLQANSPTKVTPSKVSPTMLGDGYYDTALLIHLKSASAVEKLYRQIDALQQSGKIKMSEGMDTKRYAHSFTMYKLIRPNSKENKAIENLLNGGAEEASYIDALVKQAGAKGSGVKADDNSITTSNFARASQDLQQKHLQNLRSFSRF